MKAREVEHYCNDSGEGSSGGGSETGTIAGII